MLSHSRSFITFGDPRGLITRFEDVRWLGVLRTADALQMYRRQKTASVDAERVIDLLIHHEAFPRSIARCVIGSVLDSLPPRAEATPACNELAAILAQRPETSNAVMLHGRIGLITDALDHLRDVVAESDFVARTNEIAAV